MTIKSKFKRLARWFLWAIAILTVTVGALVISDSLHTKTCPDPVLKGKVVHIPGERMEFLNSGNEADGYVISMDTVREPDKPGFQLRREAGHLHPHQEERFEIIEGRHVS